MNSLILKDILLEEHSKKQCEKIVAYIGNDRDRFAELMKCFFCDEYRLSQRASWPLSFCVSSYPHLIKPYLKKLIDNLSRKGQHDAIMRNTLKLLQNIPIPTKYHGLLMDSCFNFITSPQTAVAIKAFSLTVLGNLSVCYPEITSEIKLVIEEQWEHESSAFRSRARQLLKKLN